MSGERTGRQVEMLREMGITPLWRLRAAAAEVVPAENAAEQSVLAAAPEPVPATAPVARVSEPAPVSAPAVAMPAGDVAAMDWPALKSCVAGCTACSLHKTRNKTVFGVGDEQADWLFVGEGPGADEDMQGEPFVGQAGKLLDNMLAAIELKRGSNVYIANIVKCRPPGNRNPQPEEAAACSGYLKRQIELIRPKLIVALGKVAAVNLLGRDASISSLRGAVHEYQGIPLIVTYHPAYLLRTLPDKAKAWEDLCFAVDTMRGLAAAERSAAS
ncbi:MAG: uracil-DNA glycosylase [Burkholderiales bacterium]|nr:uracil-DNA glycosylase [Burkholderiales bacterium]